MQPYRNPTSGVTAFTLHPNAIDIEFRDGARYRYDHLQPGPEHVAAMTHLALEGRGLATYINQHVRDRFRSRLPRRRNRTPRGALTPPTPLP